jgi:hypothetical protein
MVNASEVLETPVIWRYNNSPGGLNGSWIEYRFNCSTVALENITPVYSNNLTLPTISVTLTMPSTIKSGKAFGVVYNLTSPGGFNFDSRSVYLNISSLFYSSPAKNITYPDIDSFNSSISGNWLLAAPNTTGYYNATLIVQDTWGNILTSGVQTIRVTDDSVGINFIALIFIAFAFIYISHEGEDV